MWSTSFASVTLIDICVLNATITPELLKSLASYPTVRGKEEINAWRGVARVPRWLWIPVSFIDATDGSAFFLQSSLCTDQRVEQGAGWSMKSLIQSPPSSLYNWPNFKLLSIDLCYLSAVIQYSTSWCLIAGNRMLAAWEMRLGLQDVRK